MTDDEPLWLEGLIEVVEDPDVDPRAEDADFTLLGLLMDEIHKHHHPDCTDTTCPQHLREHFGLAYELTLQGWTLPEAPR